MVILVQYYRWSIVGTCFTDYACLSHSDWRCLRVSGHLKISHTMLCQHACMLTMHSFLACMRACMPLQKNLLCVSIQLVEFWQYWACRQSYFQFEMLRIICLSFVLSHHMEWNQKCKTVKTILVNEPRQVCCGIYHMRDRLRGWSWVCNIPPVRCV